MNEFPAHLLLPLLASLLFVCGLLFIKRTSSKGVGPWTGTFIANLLAAIIFSTLWLAGGTMQPVTMLWQPAVIAGLYILGQIFTFAAIEKGDVSVATPVFGVKVIVVAFLLAILFREPISMSVWLAVGLSAIGIVLVQWNPTRRNASIRVNPVTVNSSDSQTHRPAGLLLTVLLALAAASSFAAFDVVVQSWAPAWGPGRLLPIVFWMAGIVSFGFWPFVQREAFADKQIRSALLAGTLLIALQAVCIVFTLAAFGDAARVNVVYTMRGMWGVLLAWLAAIVWGGNEAVVPRKVMLMRLAGASLLFVAVVLVVLSEN